MKLKKCILIIPILFSLIAMASGLPWSTKGPDISRSHRKVHHEESSTGASILADRFEGIYDHIKISAPTLDSVVFRQAYIGYLNLRASGKAQSSLLTIADLNIHSSQPRLWIIDLDKDSLLINTFVAHGRGSGIQEARTFSNRPNSNQSSLGFYLTGETYQGKHGRSLKLDGLDQGFNTNARSRGIVLHGAWYVGASILNGQNRMGVSQGCPAVAESIKDQIIDLIQNRSVLFIHGSSRAYHSAWLNEQAASQHLLASHVPSTEEQELDSVALQ